MWEEGGEVVLCPYVAVVAGLTFCFTEWMVVLRRCNFVKGQADLSACPASMSG